MDLTSLGIRRILLIESACLASVLTTYLDNRLFYPIQHVDFFLTRACNLKCSYCFVYGEKDGHCPRSVIDRFLDIVPMLTHGSPTCGITLFGGEPLLVFDRIAYFVERAQRM